MSSSKLFLRINGVAARVLEHAHHCPRFAPLANRRQIVMAIEHAREKAWRYARLCKLTRALHDQRYRRDARALFETFNRSGSGTAAHGDFRIEYEDRFRCGRAHRVVVICLYAC